MESVFVINTILTWILILINLLLTLALIRRFNEQTALNVVNASGGQLPSKDMLPVGNPAPDFTAETLEGNPVELSMFLDRLCVFAFISSTCPPCHDLVLKLHDFQSKASSLGLELILVGLDNNEDMRKFVETTKTTFPVLVAPSTLNPFAKNYLIQGTPSVYVLDRNSKIKWAGFPDISSLDQLILSWAS